MLPEGPPPLIGRTTLTRADGAALLKANRAWVGFINQPRMLLYGWMAAFGAAALCIRGMEGFPTLLFLLSAVLYFVAVFAGYRTARLVTRGYGRDQEREVVLDDGGVTVREPGMTVTYAWSRFQRVITMRHHLALVAAPGVVLIAKRAFDDDALARVQELVAAKVPAQARR